MQKALCSALELVRITGLGTVLFEQGSVGNAFYIIFEGNVDIFVRGHARGREREKTLVKQMGAGEAFGERALEGGSATEDDAVKPKPLAGAQAAGAAATPKKPAGLREATIVTSSDTCEFFVLQRDAYTDIVRRFRDKEMEERTALLQRTPGFSSLTAAMRSEIARVCEPSRYVLDQAMATQGHTADHLMIIARGECVANRAVQMGPAGVPQALITAHGAAAAAASASLRRGSLRRRDAEAAASASALPAVDRAAGPLNPAASAPALHGKAAAPRTGTKSLPIGRLGPTALIGPYLVRPWLDRMGMAETKAEQVVWHETVTAASLCEVLSIARTDMCYRLTPETRNALCEALEAAPGLNTMLLLDALPSSLSSNEVRQQSAWSHWRQDISDSCHESRRRNAPLRSPPRTLLLNTTARVLADKLAADGACRPKTGFEGFAIRGSESSPQLGGAQNASRKRRTRTARRRGAGAAGGSRRPGTASGALATEAVPDAELAAIAAEAIRNSNGEPTLWQHFDQGTSAAAPSLLGLGDTPMGVGQAGGVLFSQPPSSPAFHDRRSNVSSPVFLHDMPVAAGQDDTGFGTTGSAPRQLPKLHDNRPIPFSVVQLSKAPSTDMSLWPNARVWFRVLGLFQSSIEARSLVAAYLNHTACTHGTAVGDPGKKWVNFAGYDLLDRVASAADGATDFFILYCKDAPIDVLAFKHPLAGSGKLEGPFPPMCRAPQQLHAVLTVHALDHAPPSPSSAASVSPTRPGAPPSPISAAPPPPLNPTAAALSEALSTRLRELSIVREVHACVGDRNDAEECAKLALRDGVRCIVPMYTWYPADDQALMSCRYVKRAGAGTRSRASKIRATATERARDALRRMPQPALDLVQTGSRHHLGSLASGSEPGSLTEDLRSDTGSGFGDDGVPYQDEHKRRNRRPPSQGDVLQLNEVIDKEERRTALRSRGRVGWVVAVTDPYRSPEKSAQTQHHHFGQSTDGDSGGGGGDDDGGDRPLGGHCINYGALQGMEAARVRLFDALQTMTYQGPERVGAISGGAVSAVSSANLGTASASPVESVQRMVELSRLPLARRLDALDSMLKEKRQRAALAMQLAQ